MSDGVKLTNGRITAIFAEKHKSHWEKAGFKPVAEKPRRTRRKARKEGDA